MKRFLLCLLLVFSLPAFSQGIKDRIFTNFAFTMGADLSFGPLNEVKLTNSVGDAFKGYSKDFSVGILSYQYGMRLNILEKGKDFSLGLWLPITASLSTGKFSYLAEGMQYNSISGKEELTSISGTTFTFGRLSFPLFLQCSFGGGATYNSDKEKGTTIGIGLDMNISPIYVSKEEMYSIENIEIKRFNAMPAINIGRRKFQKDQFVEYNLKFGYVLGNKEYLAKDEKLSTAGMVIMLTIGQILNY